MEIDTKKCVYCWKEYTRPYYVSHARFNRRKYCSHDCGYKAVFGKKHLRFIDMQMSPAPIYERVDNREYDKQLSHVTGLSRLYLDGVINLDTLRMMENEMNQNDRAAIRQ